MKTDDPNFDTYRRHIVRFPLIRGQLDTTLTTGKDFVYLYSRDIEVTPQLRSV